MAVPVPGPDTIDGVFEATISECGWEQEAGVIIELVSSRRVSLQSGVREFVGVKRYQGLSDEGLRARPQRAENPGTAERRA